MQAPWVNWLMQLWSEAMKDLGRGFAKKCMVPVEEWYNFIHMFTEEEKVLFLA
jgi:hypothetical protein